MPVSFYKPWSDANDFCNNTAINGQTGWRLPTKDELKALWDSKAMLNQGWKVAWNWSSTPAGSGKHYIYPDVSYIDSVPDTASYYVTCVR